MQYRRDIDGLRAVAVLSVLFYHTGVSPFSGGFVGVDVFFVISGFLITSLLRRDYETNEFSIPRFYERRIRRIIPALVVMSAAVWVAAYFILLPWDFKDFSESLAASSIFIYKLLL
jgi:peptidoglycan/LPS O-acetylase OafA/YrhL